MAGHKGQQGRKPKPTALKLLSGNAGKRPLNTAEPTPDPGLPKPPSWLSPRARRVWREIGPILQDMRVMTVADGTALSLLADAMAEYTEARAVVVKQGATYTVEHIARDEEGNAIVTRSVRARPEVAIASDAWKRVRTMLVEFGLTPSSRSRVKAGSGQQQADDPFGEFMSNG